MKKYIKVKFQFEGLHQWKSCPLEQVSFLKDKHRHIFYATCIKEVSHNDRDIEIIMFKRELEEYMKSKGKDLGNSSCEDMAQDILTTFNCHSVEILEDNENGAVIINE